MADSVKEFYEKSYKSKDLIWGEAPYQIIARIAANFKPKCKVLDLG